MGIVELLPAPPKSLLPGWKRRREWADIGAQVRLGPRSTMVVGTHLIKDKLHLIAHLTFCGSSARTEPVGGGEVVLIRSPWVMVLTLRAVQYNEIGIPERVLLEVVPTGQNPARSPTELSH